MSCAVHTQPPPQHDWPRRVLPTNGPRALPTRVLAPKESERSAAHTAHTRILTLPHCLCLWLVFCSALSCPPCLFAGGAGGGAEVSDGCTDGGHPCVSSCARGGEGDECFAWRDNLKCCLLPPLPCPCPCPTGRGGGVSLDRHCWLLKIDAAVQREGRGARRSAIKEKVFEKPKAMKPVFVSIDLFHVALHDQSTAMGRCCPRPRPCP